MGSGRTGLHCRHQTGLRSSCMEVHGLTVVTIEETEPCRYTGDRGTLVNFTSENSPHILYPNTSLFNKYIDFSVP